MDYINRYLNPSFDLNPYLGVIFDNYRTLEYGEEHIIRGRVAPRFQGKLSALEKRLKKLPGRYSVDRAGKDTYITITTPLFKPKATNWTLHLGLFLATIGTTLLVGALREGGDPFYSIADLRLGIPFSTAVLLILLVHELGHYFAARRHGMDVTLPFFIPMLPPFPFGTMGALIKMRSAIISRRMLLDIGAAGPIAGFCVALPLTVYGLHGSSWGESSMQFFTTGGSLLFNWLANIIIGPAPQDGLVLQLSSVAFAGWIGFFVTAMNLVPLGQLDGGHIAYALFGKHHRKIAYGVFLSLLALGYLWSGWFFWAFIILFFIKLRHPPVIDETIKLGPGRILIGLITLAIFILTFMPLPIEA